MVADRMLDETDPEKGDSDGVQPARNATEKTETGNSGGQGPRNRTRIGAGAPGNRPTRHEPPPRYGPGSSVADFLSRIGAEGADRAPKRVKIEQDVTVKELAKILRTGDVRVIQLLFLKGVMRTVNQVVQLEHARQLALDLGYELIDSESAQSE